MNLLFICSRNKWRSPTAQNVWQRKDGINARSAGTAQSARHKVSFKDIEWADKIFVMEQKHKRRLNDDFRAEVNHKVIHVLDIPDDYNYMDEDLVAMLENGVEAFLE